MIVNIHASRDPAQFTLVPFARNQDGLSVTTGDFLVFGWETFGREGLTAVAKAMAEYHTAYKRGPSQFDKMSGKERAAFLKKHVNFQVDQRSSDLWWIDLMQPVGDGSIPSPMGPPHRVEFHPSEGAERFFDALLQLMPSGDEA